MVSIVGFSLEGQRGLTAEENQDLNVVAVIGSEGWATSGSAPATFAAAFLEALFPERAEQVGQMRRLTAREYQALETTA